MARVSIDVGDLLVYLAQHSAVSGIQRVVFEVIPYLTNRHDSQFIAYSESCQDVVRVPDEDLAKLTELIRTMGDDLTAKQRVCALAQEIREGVLMRQPIEMSPGSVVLVLGAAWTYPGFFNALHARKRKGVKIVVLLYDLIPVLQPLFTADTTQLFERYVWDVQNVADRVPAISHSSRRDFEGYVARAGLVAPPGGVTTLPSGLEPRQPLAELSSHALREATSQPYVLMVSTIEARKSHVLALRAWRKLVEDLGEKRVPNLVCVGRLGWNVRDFLREYGETNGLGGKMRLISNGVPDADLRTLYANCLFTIYPSSYEGWGLPISESLAFGKAVISADNSSLREAGVDLAVYLNEFTPEALAQEAKKMLVDSTCLAMLEQRIQSEYKPPTWEHVAEVLSTEIERATNDRKGTAVLPLVKSGVEYPMGRSAAFEGMDGWQYQHYLDFERRLPITGQLGDIERESLGNFLVHGSLKSQHPHGCDFEPGQPVSIEFRRDRADADLLVLSIGQSEQRLIARVVSPWGSRVAMLGYGSPLIVPLTESAGLDVTLTVTFEYESPNPREWPDTCIESLVLLRSDDLDTTAMLLSANLRPYTPAGATGSGKVVELTETLNQVLNSRSWRLTAPLRKITQRSRST